MTTPRKASTVVFSSICLLFVLAFTLHAQGFGLKPSKDDPVYKLGDVSFQYPTGYKTTPLKGEEQKTILFASDQYKEYVFVSLPGKNSEPVTTIEALRADLIAALLPQARGEFNWKLSRRPAEKAGQYDLRQERWPGFD